MKKVFVEDVKTSEIVHRFIGKMKSLDILNHLVESGRDGVAVVTWIGTIKNVKDNNFVVILLLKISLHHCQLIQICQ